MNKVLFFGASLGLLSVLMAAYVDHSLSLMLTEKTREGVLVAIKYHQLYAVLVTMIGFIIPLAVDQKLQKWLTRSAYVILAGMLLFCFSIYMSAIFNLLVLRHVVPIGGVTLMLGWVLLIYTAMLRKS